MSVTKNALIRYQTLDRCFRNPGRSYGINDLLEECNKALREWNRLSVEDLSRIKIELPELEEQKEKVAQTLRNIVQEGIFPMPLP